MKTLKLKNFFLFYLGTFIFSISAMEVEKLSNQVKDLIESELKGYIGVLPRDASEDVTFVKMLLKDVENLVKNSITKNKLDEAISKLEQIKTFILDSQEKNVLFNGAVYGFITLNQFLDIAIDPFLSNLKKQREKLNEELGQRTFRANLQGGTHITVTPGGLMTITQPGQAISGYVGGTITISNEDANIFFAREVGMKTNGKRRHKNKHS